MIDNQDMPIGFMMELAEHPDVLNQFGKLSEEEQTPIVDGARHTSSREEMRSYVENIFR